MCDVKLGPLRHTRTSMTIDGDLCRYERCIEQGTPAKIDEMFKQQQLPKNWIYAGIEDSRVVLLRWVEKTSFEP